MTDESAFGPWNPITRIGVGAFGSTWRCSHADEPSREAAVKVLLAAHADHPAYKERFAAERDILRTLGGQPHPNLASYEGSDDETGHGLTWIALSYIPGADLATCLHDGRMPDDSPFGTSAADRYRRAIVIARGVAHATAHSHARGIAHRDIKPANIRMTPEGGVVLVDFGIGRDARVDRLTSADQQSPHTVTYAAPEILSRHHVADAWLGRLDVYSLGVVLHLVLTGKTAAVPTMIDDQGRALPLPRSEPLELPAVYNSELGRLLRAMTEPDPRLRPDMAAVSAALESLPERLNDGPMSAVLPASPLPESATEKTWSGLDRTPVPAPTRTLLAGESARVTQVEDTTADPPPPRSKAPAHPYVPPPAPEVARRFRPQSPPEPGGTATWPRLALAGLGGLGLLIVLTQFFVSQSADPTLPPVRCPPGDPDCEAAHRADALCGNGVLDPGERCDDGNDTPGDGCSESCRREVDFLPRDPASLRSFVRRADRTSFVALTEHVEDDPAWLSYFDPTSIRAFLEASQRFDPPVTPAKGVPRALQGVLPTLPGDTPCAELVPWLTWNFASPHLVDKSDPFYQRFCSTCSKRYPPRHDDEEACARRADHVFEHGVCVHESGRFFVAGCD